MELQQLILMEKEIMDLDGIEILLPVGPEKTAALLDLPAEGVAGTPKVSLTGDRELYLENYKGILAYGKEEIHVNGGPWVLRILGRDLEIKAMRAGEMRITGWVDRLELL